MEIKVFLLSPVYKHLKGIFGKTAKNEQKNDDSDFLWPLYNAYKKIRAALFPDLLTSLNKDASVLLKVTNIWTS